MNQHIRSIIDISGGDRGDQWGESMGAWFDIAHALEHYDAVPFDWEYRDSPICHGLEPHPSGQNDQAIMLTEWLDDGTVTVDDLVTAGNVLNRYIRLLKHQGRDY